MKPFNLEEALAGKPVVTRNNKEVTIAGYNSEAHEMEQVVGWINNEDIRTWDVKGNYYRKAFSDIDIFMKSEVKTIKGWMNIYPNNGTSEIHSSKEKANDAQTSNCITCIEVEVSYEI